MLTGLYRGKHMATRKTKKPNPTIPTITFDQLTKMEKIPEIPQQYRDQLWRTVKVKKEVYLTEECDHFLNMLCMHFGMARNGGYYRDSNVNNRFAILNIFSTPIVASITIMVPSPESIPKTNDSMFMLFSLF